jgi:hypothetical protein
MAFAISSKEHLRTIALRSCAGLALATLALLANGCTTTYNNNNWFNHCNDECCVDTLFTAWRDHVWAKRAYHRCYPVCEHLHPSHFRRGFIAGYSAVCAGEDPYLPAVAPEDYWGYSYQSAEGNQMVGAWFEGYPEGVRAAQEDGTGAFRDVRISSSLDALMEPTADPWAEYATTEQGDQPPVLSGQEMEMPALPDGDPSAGEIPYDQAQPLPSPPMTSHSIETQPTSEPNVPLSSGRRFSWGPIR